MDPEKKIIQARSHMLLDQPFYGHIVISLELEAREDMNPPTMDGLKLYYHPDFVKELPSKQLKGVLAHEVGHIVLYHITRRQSREQIRWNISTDFAVNNLVLKEFELPDGILHNPNFADKTAEWIYNQLPETQTIEVTVTLDSHEDWKDGNGNNGNGKEKDKKGEKELKPGIGEGEGDDDESPPPDTREGLEQHIRELVAQAATVARMQGKLPGHLQELVGDILQPRLD